MHSKQVALVTGANKGIGLQIAKDLSAKGLTVLVGSRSLEKGQAAAKTIGGDALAIALDVTDGRSIAAAAERIRTELGRLDVLVNNAGIAQAGASEVSFEKLLEAGRPSVASLADVRAIFETNVFGVIAVTQAMLPLLKEGPAGRIVNVSSTVGSLTALADPNFAYRSVLNVGYSPSKTALNAVTLAFAVELSDTRVKVNAVCPGYVATDLNHHHGTGTVEEGARHPVRMALLGPDGPTGTYSNDAGPILW
jgi:NAD(P)-dependent dehydrogenase (short-subunit alcohol dehydrogenase family)